MKKKDLTTRSNYDATAQPFWFFVSVHWSFGEWCRQNIAWIIALRLLGLLDQPRVSCLMLKSQGTARLKAQPHGKVIPGDLRLSLYQIYWRSKMPNIKKADGMTCWFCLS